MEYTSNSLKILSLASAVPTSGQDEGQTNEKMAEILQPIIQLWKSLLQKIMTVPEIISPISQFSEDGIISAV